MVLLPILNQIMKTVMAVIYRRSMMMTRRISSITWSVMIVIAKKSRSRMTPFVSNLS